MNKPTAIFVFLTIWLCGFWCHSQNMSETLNEDMSSTIFSSDDLLSIQLHYSNKELKKETNDSTYIESEVIFKNSVDNWDTLAVSLRSRGNFRLKNCYFAPVKFKFKKKAVASTIFEGHKQLKLVLPCLIQRDNNDNVIKEFLAYKMYEIISPIHFKTRLLDITFHEQKGKNVKIHEVKGFLIEDDKHVAKRLNGKVYKRSVHPLGQDDANSVRNAFFQFMIGNTDFSQAYNHNVKLIFIDKAIQPVPYDFDMSGLVNCSYAGDSQTGSELLKKTSVTQRVYRGFKRDDALFALIRHEFLSHKQAVMALVNDSSQYFENPSEFETAKEYIMDFYEILADDRAFRNEIVDKAREQ